METLTAIRKEQIDFLSDEVKSDADIALIDLRKLDETTNKNIVIIKNYNPNIVQRILSKIDDDSSSYVFFQHELDLNPVKNCMVPEHREATDQEVNYLLSRKIPLDKLPILRMKDPIRRWHNFQRGSIVAIKRPNERQLYFRKVV